MSLLSLSCHVMRAGRGRSWSGTCWGLPYCSGRDPLSSTWANLPTFHWYTSAIHRDRWVRNIREILYRKCTWLLSYMHLYRSVGLPFSGISGASLCALSSGPPYPVCWQWAALGQIWGERSWRITFLNPDISAFVINWIKFFVIYVVAWEAHWHENYRLS